MGLGKTIQVIAFLCALYERYSIRGPHLIVMPLSVISGWETDIRKFCGEAFDIYVHHGERDLRRENFKSWKRRMLHVEKKWSNKQKCSGDNGLEESSKKISIVLTTYDLVIKDDNLFMQLNSGPVTWRFLVVHHIRTIVGNYNHHGK